MKKILICVVFFNVIFSNPIATEIVNEFQVSPTNLEKVEYRFFQSPRSDTFYSDSMALLGTCIRTPAGLATIDTQIYLPGMGYRMINSLALNGPFGLPDTTGFVVAYHPSGGSFHDSVAYPQIAPVPPTNYSAAKYHCYSYNLGDNEYNVIRDWYLDPTPTFGANNDDYPGCCISGYVFDNYSQPLANVKIKATPYYFTAYTTLIRTPPFYVVCSTFTAVNGYYSIDSLQPYHYYVIASANGFLTDTLITGMLRALYPITNFNFNMVIGILEDKAIKSVCFRNISSNPQKNTIHINYNGIPNSLKIYDIMGNLIYHNTPQTCMNHRVQVDCKNLPPGVYLICLTSGERQKIVKIILLK